MIHDTQLTIITALQHPIIHPPTYTNTAMHLYDFARAVSFLSLLLNFEFIIAFSHPQQKIKPSLYHHRRHHHDDQRGQPRISNSIGALFHKPQLLSSSSSSSSSSSQIIRKHHQLISILKAISSQSEQSSSSNNDGNNDNNSIDNETSNETNASSSSTTSSPSSSSCPYSMTFPMYRIPISGGKETKQFNNPSLFLLGGFLSGIRSNAQKLEFERNYKQQTESTSTSTTCTTTLLWYDAMEKLSNNDNNKDDKRIKQGKMGIHVSAFVWRALSDLIMQVQEYDDDTTLPSKKSVIIGIPNTSLIGLKQLADIINWMSKEDYFTNNDKYNNESESNQNKNIMIHAKVEEESSVPTIILEVTFHNDDDNNSKENQTKEYSKVEEQAVIQRTKLWVDRVLVQMKICPFTKSTTKSGQGLSDVGVPVGGIAYHYSNAIQYQIPLLMADTWEAISDMIAAGPSGRDGISSILLSAPSFDSNFQLWAGPVFAMLEANVSAAKAEPIIGIVCFHPYYKTPDGQSWPGFGHMHSVPRLCKWVEENDSELYDVVNTEDISAGGAFQRRTPHATINVLRAEQLEAAEGRRSTGNLYSVNIRRLYEVGFDKLENDLNQERLLNTAKDD